MNKNMFTPEANERITVCKGILDLIKDIRGEIDEEWHVFTFKEDKKNRDPWRFKVCKTKRKNYIIGTAIIPSVHLFNIVFRDDSKTLKLEFFTRVFDVELSSKDLTVIQKFLPSSMNKWNIEVKKE